MRSLINYPNIASAVFNTPLYATPELASSVRAFLVPKVLGQDSNVDSIDMSYRDEKGNRLNFNLVNNIAVIPVHGALMTRRGALDEFCMEIESYERIRSRISDALEHPDVDVIVLDVHSGGGMAVGCKETADFIFESGSQKPIYGIANYVAGSAAYFLLSACTRVYVSDTSIVGSIGVIWEHFNFSELMSNEGIKVTTLFRGDNKNDCSPWSELSDSAAAEVNERLDRSYQMFTESVAKYRGLSVETVVNTQAKVFDGPAAVSLGLADEVAVPQSAINQISQQHPKVIEKDASFAIQAQALELNSKL